MIENSFEMQRNSRLNYKRVLHIRCGRVPFGHFYMVVENFLLSVSSKDLWINLDKEPLWMVAHRANRDVTGKEKKTFMPVSLDYIHYLE